MCNLGRNNDLDSDVCRYVFKVNPEEYKWGVPFFSSDRNAAAIVNTEMALREDSTKEEYEKELARIVKASAKHNKLEGLSITLMILLPEEICNAAIMVCRKNDQKATPSGIDKGRHVCR